MMVFQNLVSIDAPDGSGKSSLANIVGKKIGAQVIKPSYFGLCESSKIIEDEFRKWLTAGGGSHSDHNRFFLKTMAANYRDFVFPMLAKGEIVILDSSEIRALAFVIDQGDEELILATMESITTEFLTGGIKPRLRVFIGAEPNSLLNNLLTKESLDKGDPNSLESIHKRIKAYDRAKEFVGDLDGKDVIRESITIHHVSAEERSLYLDGKADEIVSILRSRLFV